MPVATNLPDPDALRLFCLCPDRDCITLSIWVVATRQFGSTRDTSELSRTSSSKGSSRAQRRWRACAASGRSGLSRAQYNWD